MENVRLVLKAAEAHFGVGPLQRFIMVTSNMVTSRSLRSLSHKTLSKATTSQS